MAAIAPHDGVYCMDFVQSINQSINQSVNFYSGLSEDHFVLL